MEADALSDIKKRIRGAWEMDVFSGWRRYISMRASTRRWVKRHFNRRIRHADKITLRTEPDE